VTPTSERLLGVLRRFTPEPTARVLLLRACLEQELSPHELTEEQLARVLPRLMHAARVVVGPRRGVALADALGTLRRDGPRAAIAHVPITDEHDARRARIVARQMCDQAGAPRLSGLKVATGLSELTRNILSYAGTGRVSIEILDDPTRARIEAHDEGPGIADVDLVLSGDYRSRTGLGRGLLGTRKMADRFELKSAPGGTHVLFEMLL
jgi:serine/threonine-protein kinase RsbT